MITDRRRFLFAGSAFAAAAGLGTYAFAQAQAAKIKIDAMSVLIVVDVQNCFLPGGSLAVGKGEEVIPVINKLGKDFANVVMTQDWHTADHVSFASQHSGKKPFEMVKLPYGDQVLWPDHCVQGTAGARFHPDLDTDRADAVIRKGFRTMIDSYSAFFENDRTTPTGLEGYLHTRGVEDLYFVGLALDFCVHHSAVDAARLGFRAVVMPELCRSIDLDGSLATARQNFAAHGVREE